MGFFSSFRHSESSMKRKLFGYMMILVLLLLLVFFSGLFLFGQLNNTKKNLSEMLDLQMAVFEKDMVSFWEDLAVMNIYLSQDMTEILETYLVENQISFETIRNNMEHIQKLQETMIGTLSQNLRQSNSSGAFVLLNTTVNSNISHADVSRSGLYLQLNGFDSSVSDILLYRGIPEIGKAHEIMPHRKWRLEFQIDNIPNYQYLLSLSDRPLEESYCLTPMFILPGTSERVILMSAPMMDQTGNLYGLCGFEVSQSFFKQLHMQPTNLSHMSGLLSFADKNPVETSTERINGNASLSTGTASGYYVAPKGVFQQKSLSKELSVLTDDSNSYVGLTEKIYLTPNNPEGVMAIMIPKSDFDSLMKKNNLQIMLLILLLLFFAASCCLYFSRKFLSPVLQGLEALKGSGQNEGGGTTVAEIDDLIDYLSSKDKAQEAEMQQLQLQQETALREVENVQAEMSRLTEKKKQEIDPDVYERVSNWNNILTPKEREIFQMYADGKSTKEIQELANITLNTLKYHNRHIYDKLGVSSRKQLLMYATLIKQEEKQQTSESTE